MKAAKLVLIGLALVIAAGAVYAAEPIKAKPQWWGKAPGEKPVVSGTVANVSLTNIAVQTREGVKPFTVSDKTRVVVRGQKAGIGDVKVGDPVNVKFQLVMNNVPLALAIAVPKPPTQGEIVSMAGDVITLRDKGKVDHRVVVGEKTKYISRGYEGKLSDLRMGYRVTARGAMSGDAIMAEVINFTPAVAKGTVVAKDGMTITVKTVRQLNYSLQAGPATAVLVRPRVGPNVKGTMDKDVVVGAPVNVGYTPGPGGPLPLLWVEVLTGV